jgi:alpha-tubulin suppressor-like RCC1 family protein
VSWGDDDGSPHEHGQVTDTPTGTDFVAVAAGDFHSLALKDDGSLVSWGYDHADQVTDTPAGTGFVAIAGGVDHSLALKDDGSIVSWGRDTLNQVSNTPAGTVFVAIAGGGGHSLALKADESFAAVPGLGPLSGLLTAIAMAILGFKRCRGLSGL